MDNQLIFWYQVVTAHAEVIVLTNLPAPLRGFRAASVCVGLGVPVMVGKRVTGVTQTGNCSAPMVVRI